MALQAELSETHASTSKVRDLEKDVKEKNLLIGKLRHEGLSIHSFDLSPDDPASCYPERASYGSSPAFATQLFRNKRRSTAGVQCFLIFPVYPTR